ncbi:TPA: hypothetical protein DIU22_03440 [Candidatus Woesebacteria bacterium]|nr:hypothetical protein [Candidatus Woesebacteria bacterium]
MEYYCLHQGEKSELSSSVQKAIKAKKIIINGCLACDFHVPMKLEDLERLEPNSLDITCVGPQSSACPDQEGIKVINP